jgi:hypothetical protein
MSDRPQLLIGVDARPIRGDRPQDGMDEVVRLGCNALHRFDDGPKHQNTVHEWVDAARVRKLYYIIQGTACEKFNYDYSTPDPFLVALAQDDEPDLNRWDSQKDKVPLDVLEKQVYTPTAAPHKSNIGWTRPEILHERYARWKAKAPHLPVSLNLNGQTLSSAYYADGKWHKPYLVSCDESGLDLYPRNASGERWPLNFLPWCFEKLKLWHHTVLDAYIECSDQVLDGNASGGTNRGPTPAEQSNLFWSVLLQGARRIWYFPQRIGAGFQYNNMTPENAARARLDNSTALRHQNLIVNGVLSAPVQNPVFAWNVSKGLVTFPWTETRSWTLGDERLTVTIDYSGKTDPVIEYVPGTQLPPLEVENAKLRAALAEEANRNAQLTQEVMSLGGLLADRDAIIADLQSEIGSKQTTILQQAERLDHILGLVNQIKSATLP